mmetsp:Transcript_50116/g.161088  ORF Transcript_50116/g.161088 Transcript_50116/m.161088 type:complete len:322 (+) Transcript_50116:1594-2559(+)
MFVSFGFAFGFVAGSSGSLADAGGASTPSPKPPVFVALSTETAANVFFVELFDKVFQGILQLLLPTCCRGTQHVAALFEFLGQGLRCGKRDVPCLVFVCHGTLHHGSEALKVDPTLLVGRQDAPHTEGCPGHRHRCLAEVHASVRRGGTPPEPRVVLVGAVFHQPLFGVMHIFQRVHQHTADAVYAVEWCNCGLRVSIHTHHVDVAVDLDQCCIVQISQHCLVLDAIVGHALCGDVDVQHSIGLEVDLGEGAEGLGEIGLLLRSPFHLPRRKGSLRHAQEVAEHQCSAWQFVDAFRTINQLGERASFIRHRIRMCTIGPSV